MKTSLFELIIENPEHIIDKEKFIACDIYLKLLNLRVKPEKYMKPKYLSLAKDILEKN